MWKRLRHWLWKRGLRYPALPGWSALVEEVASVDLWTSPPKDGLSGLVGAPLEWRLLERDLSGRVVSLSGTCAWSGEPVNGTTPLVEQPDGTYKHDLSAWGVRCARCGVPLLCKYAGMKLGNDVPSCPPCRRAVNHVKKGVDRGQDQ